MRLIAKPEIRWKVPRDFEAFMARREGPPPFWMRPLAFLILGLVPVPGFYASNAKWRENPNITPAAWASKPYSFGFMLFLAFFCAYVTPWLHSRATHEVKFFARNLVFTRSGKPEAVKWSSIRGYFWLEPQPFLVLVLVIASGSRERRVYLGVPTGGEERRLVDEAFARAGVNRWCPDENPFGNGAQV